MSTTMQDAKNNDLSFDHLKEYAVRKSTDNRAPYLAVDTRKSQGIFFYALNDNVDGS